MSKESFLLIHAYQKQQKEKGENAWSRTVCGKGEEQDAAPWLAYCALVGIEECESYCPSDVPVTL